jgi:hypothetical protein
LGRRVGEVQDCFGRLNSPALPGLVVTRSHVLGHRRVVLGRACGGGRILRRVVNDVGGVRAVKQVVEQRLLIVVERRADESVL